MSAAVVTPAEVMARLRAGQDPELAKLVAKRAEEEGVTPMVALVALLLGRP